MNNKALLGVALFGIPLALINLTTWRSEVLNTILFAFGVLLMLYGMMLMYFHKKHLEALDDEYNKQLFEEGDRLFKEGMQR